MGLFSSDVAIDRRLLDSGSGSDDSDSADTPSPVTPCPTVDDDSDDDSDDDDDDESYADSGSADSDSEDSVSFETSDVDSDDSDDSDSGTAGSDSEDSDDDTDCDDDDDDDDDSDGDDDDDDSDDDDDDDDDDDSDDDDDTDCDDDDDSDGDDDTDSDDDDDDDDDDDSADGSAAASDSEDDTSTTTAAPTTGAPTVAVKANTDEPTAPTPAPSSPTLEPTASPTVEPTESTMSPTVTGSAAGSGEITEAPAPEPTLWPTLEPTEAPTFTVCDTDDALNIGFLMDESGSVSSDEWDVVTEFVARIATYDVAGPSYVALWEFASKPTFQTLLNFTHVSHHRHSVAELLRHNQYSDTGLTYTWDATNRVMDHFWRYRKSCSDGCDTRDDLLFLFTDGAPTDDLCPDMVRRVNQSDIDIVVVVIGESWEEVNTWYRNVTCLDYKDRGRDVYVVSEFSDSGLRQFEMLIRNKTCNGLHPAGESDRGGEAWVYDDGSTGLGPVPTGGGHGGVSEFGSGNWWEARYQNELQHQGEAMEQLGEEPVEHMDVSLSPVAMYNLWAMIVFVVCGVIACTVVLFARRSNTKQEDLELDPMASDAADQYLTD